ncbi:MAG: 2-phosphoglycerate kinase [Actinobacteria bacterium]|nr:2-phosphoglycerate kinase [Actinomycetota bacterium]
MIKGSDNRRQIIISDDKHGLPYSKGLMSSSLMATGLPPSRSYKIARLIEQHLMDSGRFSIKVDELKEVVYQLLLLHEGKGYADTYVRWQALLNLDRPMVVLIGGTTGVGKSTIATEVAHRLGITHIVATDSLREVMRAIFSKDLMPALHESTFLAWKAVNQSLEEDPLIAGFCEQVKVVAVGIRAVIDRAIREGLNVIIEGAHVVPGFINSSLCEKAFIVPMIITVDDEDLHRSHFYIRELRTEGLRPFERYRENFELIRKIGKYIEELAEEYCIPVLSSHNLDTTITAVLEEVLDHVLGPPEGKGVNALSVIKQEDLAPASPKHQVDEF